MSEELIVRHCSPTLAGIKTGSLFSSEYSSEDEVKIYVSKNVEIITPVLKAIYKNNYKIKTERIFYE